MNYPARNIVITIISGLLVLAFIGGCASPAPKSSEKAAPVEELDSESSKPKKTEPAESTDPEPAESTDPEATGLQINDETVGSGAEAQNGGRVTVHYTGRLADGTKFDSSLDRSEPFEFVLGEGSVIEGWDKGVLGMKVGGKRKLVIPPEMGYGAQGAGGAIPPNAVLTFDIELLNVQ